ncbi:hypothetical protein [Nostoc sp.]|uniref:hypothetical protein n=1 Tax=Nostoc sp. TaxID=1180 RepID=UPI002FFA6A5D
MENTKVNLMRLTEKFPRLINGKRRRLAHKTNLSLRGSRWMLQPDNLKLGIGCWGLGIGHFYSSFALLPFPQSPVPNPLTTTDIGMGNLCEF